MEQGAVIVRGDAKIHYQWKISRQNKKNLKILAIEQGMTFQRLFGEAVVLLLDAREKYPFRFGASPRTAPDLVLCTVKLDKALSKRLKIAAAEDEVTQADIFAFLARELLARARSARANPAS